MHDELAANKNTDIFHLSVKQYVGRPYCRAEMYAGRVACCSLVSHDEYADGTDKRTDVRPLHYAFRQTRPA